MRCSLKTIEVENMPCRYDQVLASSVPYDTGCLWCCDTAADEDYLHSGMARLSQEMKLKHITRFFKRCIKREVSYAAVIPVISEFVASLIGAKMIEQNAENSTMHPSLTICDWMKYKAIMDRIGRTDDIVMDIIRTKALICLLSNSQGGHSGYKVCLPAITRSILVTAVARKSKIIIALGVNSNGLLTLLANKKNKYFPRNIDSGSFLSEARAAMSERCFSNANSASLRHIS